MNEPMALMTQPHMGFFAAIFIGGLAGWFAGMITGMKHGIFTNILIGIVGYYIASDVASALNIAVVGSLMRILVATIGAVVLVYIWQMLRGNAASQ